MRTTKVSRVFSWVLPLVLIVGLSLVLRLFQIRELFYFTHDEETIVWRVMPLLRDKNLFLLGGVTPLHVHLGPWFYYLSAFVLALSKLNPVGWGVAGAIVGSLSAALVFILGKKFFNLRVGLIASLLYSVSFLQVAFDRHWWPLVLDPLIGIGTVLLLAQIVKKKLNFSPWLAGLLALGIHADLSNAALILLTMIVWVKYRLPVRHRAVVLALSIFALSFVPLVAFDIKNQGVNVRQVSQYFSETKPQQGLSLDRFVFTLGYIPRSLSRLIVPGSNELSQSYAYCPKYSLARLNAVSLLMTLLTLSLLVYFLLKRKEQPAEWIVSTYLLLLIIGLTIYGNFFSSDLFDHYLATLFPLFFLMVAITAEKLMKGRLKYLIVLVLVVAILWNLKSLSQISNQYGFAAKQEAVTWTLEYLQGQDFALDALGSCFRYNGVRYLFTLTGREPVLSFVDPNFFWLYKESPAARYPETLVVFTTPGEETIDNWRDKYLSYLSRVKKRAQFDGVEVLIVDNSDGKFTIDF